MKGLRRAQVFINRYYESIKLVLLVVILALVAYTFLNTLASNAESSRHRGEAVIRIVKAIEEKTDDQTKVINRQFQALCFLLVETSGQDGLKQLDPPLEQQCRNLARELREEEKRTSAEQLPADRKQTITPRR